jgi:2-succinyl-6-hydroxy-2,4-cyclohexadiene-1-carboxylate synthase
MITGYHAEQFATSTPAAGRPPPGWLLLHGFTGSARDWAGVWPASHPALAIDLPGHGQSPDPEKEFSKEIQRLLRALPETVHSLAGYSLGGRIALALMAAAPERFQRLVIISAHPGLETTSERAARRRQDQQWIDCLRDQGIARFATAWQHQALFHAQAARAPAAVTAQHRQRLAQRPEGLARNLACFGLGQMPPTWTAIEAFNGELHWITGEEDAKFTAIGKGVKHRRPATRHDIIDDCGHNPLIEAPRKLRELLAPSPLTPAGGG